MKNMTVNTNLPLGPQTQLVLLSGVPVRVEDVAEKVGVYDEIRSDVRRLSNVQPVEKVSVERADQGYRGVLYSHGKPYLFVMDAQGFVAKPAPEGANVFRLCERLSDAEAKLTAAWDAHVAERQQFEINVLSETPSTNFFTALYQGPNSGPVNDVIERVPGAYRQRQKPAQKKVAEAAGGVVVNDDDKILLIKPTNGYGGYEWTFPKGYLTESEQKYGLEIEGARREVEEETGFVVEPIRTLATIKHNDGGVCTYYQMKLRSDKAGERDGEVEETRWVTFMEAMELLNDDKDVELLGIAFKEVPSLIIKSEQHTGFMVALYVPRALAKRIAVRDGLDADELHVTLVYLGKGLSEEDKKKATAVVRTLSEVTPPISGKLAGVGRFSASSTSEGRDVVYLSVDSPSITRFRPVLVDALNTAGIAVNEVHGYTPHVTLAYISQEAESPLKRFEPVDVTFTKLCAVSGEDRMQFPMRARMTLKKARNVKEPGKRGAHPWIDDKGNARYDEKPTQKQPQKNRDAGKAKGLGAVPLGQKPLRVFKNPMGVAFKRRNSDHEADAFDRPASRSEQYRVENVSEGEADLLFNELKNSKHKNFTAFLNDVIKPLWDDDDGKNPWSLDAARAYVGNIMLYLERDGAIENARDALHDRVVDYERLAKSLASMERSQKAQQFIRTTLREMLAHYGATAKTHDDRWKNHIRIDGRLKDAAAYHAWDGRVAVRIDYVAGMESFARAVPEGARLKQNIVASKFHALIHEEFHGASNGARMSYQGAGIIVEEVATEVAARFVMRDKFGHIEAEDANGPLRTWEQFLPSADGPYGDYISAVVAAVCLATGKPKVWAEDALDKACLRTKQADAPLSSNPSEHVRNFVDAFGDALTQDEKDALVSTINLMAVRKLEMFKALNVKQPGAKGGKYWVDDKGNARYDEKPVPEAPVAEPAQAPSPMPQPAPAQPQPVQPPTVQSPTSPVSVPKLVVREPERAPQHAAPVSALEPAVSSLEAKAETKSPAQARASIDFPALAKSFESMESPEAGKHIRNTVRSILHEYGMRSKLPNTSEEDSYKLEKNTGGYHRLKDSCVIMPAIAPSYLQSFAKAINDGTKLPSHNDAVVFKLLVHEELHGASNMSQDAYQNVGIVVEEVTTEAAARKIMRDKFGDLRADNMEDNGPYPLNEWINFQVSHNGSYGTYLSAVQNAVAAVSDTKLEQLGLADKTKQLVWAGDAIERASMKMKQDGLKRANTKEEHLGNFLDCFGDDLSPTSKLALAEKLRAIPL